MSSRVLSGSTMACPSSSSTATAWKTKAICDTASKISCNFNNPSSMFLFLSSIPNRHNKPLRFTACSLDPSSFSSCSTSSAPSSTSSSSSSWSTYYAATCRHVRSKCTENERIHDVGFSIIKKAKAHNSLKVASKWVARKRPLWRKFWFASKKMRSIILLNVITVVYGITITYLALSAKLFEMLTVLGRNNENYIDCRNVDVLINENVDVSVTTICSKKSAEVPSSMTVFVICHTSDIPVVKGVETSMDPATFSAVRFVMSAIPFLPFVFHARDDFKTRNAGMELGLWVSLGYLMEAIGLLTADAGRASFISLFTVIVVPLLDGILGAMVPARTWFGVLMSVLGVAMLECSGSPPIVGDLLNFLSAIFFGIHMLRTEHISRSTKKEKFLPLLGYEVCVVALLSTIWASVGGWFDPVHGFNQSSWTWTDLQDWIVAFPWIPALYTGVFSTGLCLWIEIAAMRDVSATETAIIYGLEPLWGAGFAWFLLGERWGTIGWIGAALVLGGSLMVQILGCLPANKSIEAEEGKQKDDFLLVRDKQKMQKGFSTSPVVVSTRKDVIDLFK